MHIHGTCDVYKFYKFLNLVGDFEKAMIYEEGFGLRREADSTSFFAHPDFAGADEIVVLEEFKNFPEWNLDKKAIYLIVYLLVADAHPTRRTLAPKLFLEAVPSADWAILLVKLGPWAKLVASKILNYREGQKAQCQQTIT